MRHTYCNLYFLLLAIAPGILLADQVAVNGERITDLRVSPWGMEAFAIKTTNTKNTMLCPGQWLVFNRSQFAGSNAQEAYDRAFSLALSAMTADSKVFVMVAADCTTGKSIGFLE